MAVGAEWMIDAEGCAPELLRDKTTLSTLCAEIIKELDLHVVGEALWHQFPPPGGVTGLFLLTESHLACHTYPESGTVTFNLYCCNARPEWPWRERLRASLGAQRVRVRFAQRGADTKEQEAKREEESKLANASSFPP